jgi:hypothetical protein
MTLAYASKLTLEQYQLFELLLSPALTTDRPCSVNLMLVVQAILYVLTAQIHPGQRVCEWEEGDRQLSNPLEVIPLLTGCPGSKAISQPMRQ